MIPNQITIHHSASGANTTLDEINAWHKARNFTLSKLGYYVGYHYVIFPNGSFVPTRLENEMGCHSIPNDGKIGICLVGNFQSMIPSTEAINSLEIIVKGIKTRYNIDKVLCHRECNTTECPGDILFEWVLRQRISWLQRLLNILLNKPKTNV